MQTIQFDHFRKPFFWTMVFVFAVLCAGCGAKKTSTPGATSTPVPPTATAPTATASTTATARVTLSVYDQLNTRSVELHQTATILAQSFTMTPTPTGTPTPLPTVNLGLYAPRPVEPHPLAISAAEAGQITELRQIGQGRVTAMVWSPDEKYLAVATTLGVGLYDTTTHRLARWLNVNDRVRAIAFRPDGQALAVQRSTAVEVWDVATGQRVMQRDLIGNTANLVFSANGQVTVHEFVNNDNDLWTAQLNLLVLDAASGETIYTEARPYSGMARVNLDLSVDQNLLLYSGREGLSIRNLVTGETRAIDFQPDEEVVFSPDGSQLIAKMGWGTAGLTAYNLTNGKFTEFRGEQCSDVWRSSQKIICQSDGGLILIDPNTMKEIGAIVLPPLGSIVTMDDFGRIAWLIDDEISILDWKTEGVRDAPDITWFKPGITASGMLEIGGAPIYAAAGGDVHGEVQVWNVESGRVLAEIHAGSRPVTALAFSPDQHTLAWLDVNSTLYWWNVFAQQEIRRYPSRQKLIGPLVFSPDNTHLFLMNDDDHKVVEVNLQTGEASRMGEKLSVLNPAGQAFNGFAPFIVTQGGHFLSVLLSENNSRVHLVDFSSGEQIELPYQTSREYGDEVFIEALTSSPDGRFVAAITNEVNIDVWNFWDKHLINSIPIYNANEDYWWIDMVQSFSISPSGELIVICDNKRTRLWGVGSGKEVAQLNTCDDAAFTADGRYLITGKDGVIRMWGLKAD